VKPIEKALERARKNNAESRRRNPAEPNPEQTRPVSFPEPDTAVADPGKQQARYRPVDSEQLVAKRVVAHLENDPRAVPFDILRTKVLKTMREKAWRTLAVYSASPGAGKSLVASNLAVSMAREGNQTILLVDLDLKNPSIHKYFSLQPEQGIEAHLEAGVPLSDLLLNPGLERLTILPGKNRVAHSSQLLSSKAFAQMHAGMLSRTDPHLIIFDLPPLLVNDDALIFLDKVDAGLLVIEEGKNTEEEIRNSLRLLQSTELLGTVLNKGEPESSGYYYGYGAD
jgi:capsular exopolysaccharide synthesis family protein